MMSADVVSELNELFQNLCTTAPNAGDDGLGLARQWVANLEGQIGTLLVQDGGRATGGETCQVHSPFDASLSVRVRPSSEPEQDSLRAAWFPAGEDPDAEAEESAFDFLCRWARAIERYADLVASVVAAFSGSCLAAVRQSEVPRVLGDIRFWASRCTLERSDGTERHAEDGAPLPHTCQVFVTSAAAALRSVTREVSAALAAGWRHQRSSRVIVSANTRSGAAPIAHLLVQLALSNRSHRSLPIASLPVTCPTAALGDCVVLGDAATAPSAVTASGAALSATKMASRNGARGVTIVCESADSFAAAEAVKDSAALWCAGQMLGSAHLVLVQESAMLAFLEQLTERMSKLRVAAGSQGDVGTLTTELQRKRLADALSSARSDGADAEKLGVSVGVGGVLPLLITGEQPAGALASLETQEGLDGAFVYVLPFRTAKEALKLANHAPLRLRASLWSEVPAQAWEMALGLHFQHVEINCVLPVDPRVAALVDAPEEWRLCGNVELSGAHSGEGMPSAPSSGGLFHAEEAPAGSVKKAAAAATAAAAKWSATTAAERRSALRPAVAALSRELGAEAARRMEDVLRSADDLAAGRAWAVKEVNFAGQVVLQRAPRGVVAFLIDANFGLMPLCEAVLRALLFGNAVVLVTALPHANALSRSGLDKLDAVALAAYPEDCPNAATEALAKDLCATSGLGALLFACSLTPARLIGRAAVSEGPRALCLEGWGQEDGVSGAELEVLQEMCVQHRAIWNPVLDAFAN